MGDHKIKLYRGFKNYIICLHIFKKNCDYATYCLLLPVIRVEVSYLQGSSLMGNGKKTHWFSHSHIGAFHTGLAQGSAEKILS